MIRIGCCLWPLLVLFCSGFAHASLPSETVVQFPNGTWVENIAVRPNGELLVTILSSPEVYSIEPSTKSLALKLIHRFENVTGATGITEVRPDVFQVALLSVSPAQTVPGSAVLYELDFTVSGEPKVQESLKLPDVDLPNGLVALNQHKVLVADSAKGNIVVADLQAKTAEVVIEDPLLKPAPNSASASGVNGLKIRGDTLYFTNSGQNILGYVHIDLKTGSAKGSASKIASGLPPSTAYDDFALDRKGNAYLADSFANVVERLNIVTKDQAILSGKPGTLEISEPTSAALGRNGNENTLFVATAGGSKNPQYGVIGGQVKAIKIHKEIR